jgi:transposase InsO family protein
MSAAKPLPKGETAVPSASAALVPLDSALTRGAGAGALNGDPKAQAIAGDRFRVINQIISQEHFPEVHKTFPKVRERVRYVAEQKGISERQIYRWLGHWKMGGISALAPRIRSDKGASRSLNLASLSFLLSGALPKAAEYGTYSAADLHRIHEEERASREANVRKVLSRADQEKYRRYVDREGRLTAEALLSKTPSCATFARMVAKIPTIARKMASLGEAAYRDAEIISHRDIPATSPMDFVVMDHRVLDVFCLVRDGRRGWKLVRPWLTAAIDMRTRKWLAWVIVETPSSDSIAAVLKRLLIAHGAPLEVYWDNGKDFRCHYLEGRRETRITAAKIERLPNEWTGALDSLGIRVRHAIARNP